jgi:hypothetical protein
MAVVTAGIDVNHDAEVTVPDAKHGLSGSLETGKPARSHRNNQNNPGSTPRAGPVHTTSHTGHATCTPSPASSRPAGDAADPSLAHRGL